MASTNSSGETSKRKKRTWDESYNELKDFLEKTGESDAQLKATSRLGRWASHQRTKHARNELTDLQIEKLHDIKFNWESHADKLDQQWKAMFLLLKKYKHEYGHTRVTQGETYCGESLGNWVSTQQATLKKNKMKDYRKEQLDEVEFEWIRDERLLWKDTARPLGRLDDVWNGKFLTLVDYKRQHNNTLVPARYMAKHVQNGEEFDLGQWVHVQRNHHRDGVLRKDREKKLRSINFVFKIDFYDADASHHQKKWDDMYQKLELYKKEHGNCDIPSKYEEDPPLGCWARHQRKIYHEGTLADNRLEKLESIGFTWSPLVEQWNKMVELLKAYKREHGDCLVVDAYVSSDGSNLGSWVRTVRGARRGTNGRKGLAKEKIAELDKLGFVWDSILHYNWNIMFNALKKFKEEYGHCRVLQSYKGSPDLPCSLGNWASLQRCELHDNLKRTNNPMYAERREQLNSIGFEWESKNIETWNTMFEGLKEYKSKFGDCRVPDKYKHGNLVLPRSLGPWVHEQKSKVPKIALENDPIFVERKRRLDELDFTWENFTHENWERMFERLKQFKDENGHCRVPRKYDKRCEGLITSLGSWVGVQAREIPAKIEKMNHPLYIERKRLLDEIGFEWDNVFDCRWEDAFEELKKYHDEHGDCRVPLSYKVDDISLGSWVRAQQLTVPSKAEKNMPVFLERKRRLETLNFEWDYRVLDTRWKRMFEILVRFREKNGHCCAPLRQATEGVENAPDLGTWCYDQRKNIPSKLQSGDPDPKYLERKQQLDSIGFEWEVQSENEKKWNACFEELKQYQSQFGHCHVPSTYKNGRLYQWVRMQQSKLPEKVKSGESIYLDRKRWLESINFDFNSHWEEQREEQWDIMFKRLIEYKKEHGNCRVPYRNEKKQDAQGVLGIWVYGQRTRLPAKVKKGDPLSIEYKRKLDSIQFEWNDVHSGHWEVMFNGLLRFHKEKGHTRVPREYRDTKQPLPTNLGSWVITQRRTVLDKIAEGNETFVDRKMRLDAIGFPWRTRAKPLKKRARDSSDECAGEEKEESTCTSNDRGGCRSNLRSIKRKRYVYDDPSSSGSDSFSSDEDESVKVSSTCDEEKKIRDNDNASPQASPQSKDKSSVHSDKSGSKSRSNSRSNIKGKRIILNDSSSSEWDPDSSDEEDIQSDEGASNSSHDEIIKVARPLDEPHVTKSKFIVQGSDHSYDGVDYDPGSFDNERNDHNPGSFDNEGNENSFGGPSLDNSLATHGRNPGNLESSGDADDSSTEDLDGYVTGEEACV